MNDILIVKADVLIKLDAVRESIIAQKEKGVVVIPNGCSMFVMKPGDTLIFKFNGLLSHEAVMEFREDIFTQMEDGVIVLPAYIDFKIIRNDKPDTSDIKPPLGVMPKYIWDRKRKEELAAAIDRYSDAGKRIPEEWVEEYNEIVEKEIERY